MLSKSHLPEQDRFPLYDDRPLIFGRSKKLCHIVLSSPKVSRQHCKIFVRMRDETPAIMLLSNNYIEVNDERYDILTPSTWSPLRLHVAISGYRRTTCARAETAPEPCHSSTRTSSGSEVKP